MDLELLGASLMSLSITEAARTGEGSMGNELPAIAPQPLSSTGP